MANSLGEGNTPLVSLDFGDHENRTDLNGDAVQSAGDLEFRAPSRW